jgi:glycosyltransferase involved in cell wall biosynthesis
VCTRHRVELLERCLASLTRLAHPSYEVIVVDNTTGEPGVEALAASVGARYVVEPQTGLSRARNTGARTARGAVVAYLDDDAVAERTWLSAHAAAFEDLGLAATSGPVLPLSLNAPVARVGAPAGREDLGQTPFRIDRSTPQWFERANFGGIALGANLAVRRALFDAGWGFHESLGAGAALPGGEEHHAFFTLIRAGHAVAYLPQAVVRHRYPVTTAELDRRRSRILRISAAYMMMLLFEEPQFRRRTLRYMWQAARGKSRPWRPAGAEQPFATRSQLLAAMAAGVALYARAHRGTVTLAPTAPRAATEPPRPSVPS